MVIGGAIAKDHEAKKIRFYGSEGRLFLHPSSVNFQVQLYRHLCVAYSEKVRTSKIFIRDVTVASPYALLIFGGEPRLHFERGRVTLMNDWHNFRFKPRVAVLVKEIRRCLDYVLDAKLKRPDVDISDSPIVNAVIDLLGEEN